MSVRIVGSAILALPFIIVGYSTPCAEAQTLSGLRSEVRSPSPEKKEDDKKRRRQDPFCDSDRFDDDDDDGLIRTLVIHTLVSPYTIPRALAGDHDFNPGAFAPYPYLHGMSGLMTMECETERREFLWLTRSNLEYGDDFDSLQRLGGQFLIDTSSRFGIDSSVNYLREDLGISSDNLWFGDSNLVFRFAQSPKLQMRSGVGFNWLADSLDSNFGFNFTYSGDWFPADPWVVSTEIDWGQLGSAELFHGRFTVGVQQHRLELYTGYDHLGIGDTDIDLMIAGVRLWF